MMGPAISPWVLLNPFWDQPPFLILAGGVILFYSFGAAMQCGGKKLKLLVRQKGSENEQCPGSEA